MSMVIGKEAREALTLLLDEAHRFSHDEFCLHVQNELNRCTDAPEVGGAEPVPVATLNLKTNNNYLGRVATLECPKDEHGRPIDYQLPDGCHPLYAHPPEVGLPEGWVAVPVEPTDRMVAEAAEHEHRWLNVLYRIMLNSAPPCPGVVSMPEGFPWTPHVLEHLPLTIREVSHDCGEEDSLTGPIESIARWLESAGQKESSE